MNKLILKNNRIVILTADNEYLHPTSREIYSFIYSDTDIRGMNVIDKIDEEIVFSKYSKNPVVILSIIENPDFPVLVEICIDEKNYSYESVIETDQIIIKNTWYPMEISLLESIDSFFTRTVSIADNKYLTLKDYLYILKNRENLFFNIIDNVKSIDGELSLESISHEYRNKYFTGTLFDYQENGFKWLSFFTRNGIGAILADHMGLGKTIQTISLLCHEIDQGRKPNLIVVRSTLIDNWIREILKFTQNLTIYKHHGPGRGGTYKIFSENDITITTYDLLFNDIHILEDTEWNIILTDEAQDVKNPLAKRTEALKQIPKNVGFAITGTPLQNRLIDLWSIIDFTNPGYLGTMEEFQAAYPNDFEDGAKLEPIVKPLILKRTIETSGIKLPPVTHIPEFIPMDNSATQIYEYENNIFMSDPNSNFLSKIMKLRQLATNPSLIDKNYLWIEHTKYIRLIEIIEEFILNHEKFLIFTSFVGANKKLCELIEQRFSISMFRLDGSVKTKDRQPMIDELENIDGSAGMILNPTVGGAGLNITCANHVIHYNLEWNPATIDQASARVRRPGQERNMTIHYLIGIDTVEEYIYTKVEKKRKMTEDTIIGFSEMDTPDDLINFFRDKNE